MVDRTTNQRRWNPFRWLGRLIMAVLLLVGGLCATEVGLRVWEIQSPAPTATTAGAVPADPWRRLVVPSRWLHQELKPLTKLSWVDDQGNAHSLRTNSLGLRGPEVASPKRPGTFRVLCLGDERLLSPEMADSALCTAQLQARLAGQTTADVQVVNAGLPGGCPLTYLLLCQQRLLATQPDLLLLYLDPSQLQQEVQLRRLMRCDPDGSPRLCCHVDLLAERPVRAHEVWRKQFRVVDRLMSWTGQTWKERARRDDDPAVAEPNAELRVDAAATVCDSLDRLQQLAQSWGVPCVIVLSPPPNADETPPAWERVIRTVVKEQQWPHCHLQPEEALASLETNSKGRKRRRPKANAAAATSTTAQATQHERLAERLAVFLTEHISGPWRGRPHEGSWPESPATPASHQEAATEPRPRW